MGLPAASARARQAGRLLVLAGVFTLLNNYVPGSENLDIPLLTVIGLAAIGLGLLSHVLPWDRWGTNSPLALVPLALGLVALANAWGGVSNFSYATYFVLVFTWIGLAFPPLTSVALSPLAIFAYLLPAALTSTSRPGAVTSVTVAIPVCVLVGETIARAMRRIGQQKDQYMRLVDLSQQGIWEIDADDRTTLVNREMAEMLGSTPEDMIGRTPFEFVDEEDRPRWERGLERKRQGLAEIHDVRLRRPDGGEVWAMLKTAPILGPDGSYRGTIATVTDMTNKRRQEADLREAEERFRLAFDNAPIGLALVGPEGRFLRVNRALCRILGHEADALLARAFSDTIHPADLPAVQQQLQSMLEGRTSTHASERRYDHSSGRIVWVRLSVSLVRDPDGRPRYFIAQMEDVTARRAAEEAVRERERQLAEAQAVAHMGSWSWNLDARHMTWSDELFRVFGLAPGEGEVSCDSFLDRVHGEDRPAVELVMRHACASGESFALEHRILRPDDSVRWCHGRGRSVTAGTDGRRLLLGTLEDITERKQAEARLLASEERTRRILDTAGDAFVATDEQGRILAWNRQAEVTFGWRADEAVGRTFEDLVVPPADQAPARAHRAELAAMGGSGRRREMVATHRDGHRVPIESVVWAVRDEDGGGWVVNGFHRDISQRKALEHELERLAMVDELTGLRNRRGFLSAADALAAVAQRNHHDMALVYLDLDNMKAINDRQGHAAGDRARVAAADLLRRTFREADVIARLGGDEFCVLLADDGTDARWAVRRLEESLERAARPSGGTVSMSLGVARWHWHRPCSVEELIGRADEAMYRSKNQRRAAPGG